MVQNPVKTLAMAQAEKMAKNQQDGMKEAVRKLEESFSEIIENQNELAKGLMSVYQLLKLVAEKNKIVIPEPLVVMEVEEDEV